MNKLKFKPGVILTSNCIERLARMGKVTVLVNGCDFTLAADVIEVGKRGFAAICNVDDEDDFLGEFTLTVMYQANVKVTVELYEKPCNHSGEMQCQNSTQKTGS